MTEAQFPDFTSGLRLTFCNDGAKIAPSGCALTSEDDATRLQLWNRRLWILTSSFTAIQMKEHNSWKLS